ncbi:MAG: CorA family divalent cation transporter [Sulfuricurvum sp.]|jgi:magnesium transporter|uniref:magnesium transporter CorA family protein n=1 Tax=Sulfuricurvum sp. TaxID=2025608 RepID=UPI0025E5A20C|nr:CorA family divalent cation transporter [Sulfuricurvum sp.]MCK9373052.1 CorA family divalent cation transporter [Sulfuricurvum sp.]
MVELHELHLQDLQNPLHPSTFEEYKDYRILVLRLPEKMSQKSKITSYGFILAEDSVYFYDKKHKDFNQLPDALDEMYRFLDGKIDTLMHDIETIQEIIVSLEENLYSKFSSAFMDQWHNLKKELSRSERIILKAVDTLRLFIAKSKISDQFPLNEFSDLHEHLERTLRSNIAANDQLDNLYRYYNLRSGDRMNRSIYILTIISVIFLPLNLVVGFFGMNTGGLPFQGHPLGTAYAFMTMIIFAAILTTAVLWKIKKS